MVSGDRGGRPAQWVSNQEGSMILVWGSRIYGKTDEVPGMFYVGTKFGHLWFFPLIPLGSYLVLPDSKGEEQATKLSFSFKSFALAWLRAASLVIGALAFIRGFSLIEEGSSTVPFVTGIFGVIGFLYLKFGSQFRLASYERAKQLGDQIGLNARGTVLLELQFGRIPGDQAEALLQAAEERDLEDAKRALAEQEAALAERQAAHDSEWDAPEPAESESRNESADQRQ